MNIGVLLCDHVEDTLMQQHGDYPEMFTKLLKEADPSLTLTFYEALYDELPKDIDVCDTYLITGSQYGVNDSFPWIAKLEDFIRHAYTQNKKIIGICFGHQLIAKALGGKVIKSPKGWGIGMSVNTIKEQKPWMLPSCDNFNLLVSHQDQVVELPADTEIIASSDFCPFYMFQIGSNFLTVQGHPEFSKAYTRALIEKRKAMLGKCYEEGIESLELDCDYQIFAQWIVSFLK